MPSSWFNRRQEEPEVPPELQGKTPAQVLQAIKDAEAKAAELQAKIDAQAGQASELEQLRNKIQELEARPVARTDDPPPPPTNNGPTSVLVDEDKAFNERMAPLANVVFNSASMGGRMLAMEQLRDMSKPGGFNHIAFFNQHKAEIEGLMGQVPPQSRAHPDTWINLYNLVKGRHAEELLDASKKGENAFFVEGTAGSPPPPQEDKSERLTDVETGIAKKFGLTPEQYLKQKKGITSHVPAAAR